MCLCPSEALVPVCAVKAAGLEFGESDYICGVIGLGFIALVAHQGTAALERLHSRHAATTLFFSFHRVRGSFCHSCLQTRR